MTGEVEFQSLAVIVFVHLGVLEGFVGDDSLIEEAAEIVIPLDVARAAGLTHVAPDGVSPQAQLHQIAEAADRFVLDQEEVLDVLLHDLAERGVRLVDWKSLSLLDQSFLIYDNLPRAFSLGVVIEL